MCLCYNYANMKVFKLSPHHHSGRFLPHHHTSYSSLLFVVLLGGVLLAGVTAVTQAANFPVPPPVTNTVSVQAVVLGSVPSKGPTITTPTNNQHFTSIPIDVRGTCVPGYLVNVYKNSVLAGAAICDRNGHFGLAADLFIGQNILTANMANTANLTSPNSQPITAYFDLVSTPVNLVDGTFSGKHGNVLIKSSSEYKGTVPGKELTWELEVLGGQAPYAINVDWGDGTNGLISRPVPGQFNITHTYKKAGGYKGGYVVSIYAVDSEGTTGFIQLVAVVNNDVSLATTAGLHPAPGQWWSLLVAWPLWSILFLLVISFWLGERRGRRVEIGPAFSSNV